MHKGFRSARILPVLAIGGLICATAAPVFAADESPWDTDLHSAARLIAAAGETQNRVLRAGVQIRLEPGWKTYWRYPGDSGVPPTFDFSGSENLKTATVLWPAPVRFADGSGNSIGYKGEVILPLRVVPQNAAKPVKLRLVLDYAVCEKLCVPVKAKAEIVLTGEAGVQDAAVKAAEARVPKQAAVGDGRSPSIVAVRREAGPKPRVVVDVAAPPGAAVDIFAEGPTPEWALPLPQPIVGGPANVRRFAFELDGVPSGAKPDGATLRLTAVAGEQAVEVAFRLD